MSTTDFTYIGKNIPRRDGVDKVTGKGLFTSDIRLPGMLHAKILRSPLAHARIVSIDTSAAEALPGVRGIVTHENTSQRLYNGAAPMYTTTPGARPVLDQRIFDPVVRYIGDEVAAVAADTEEIAQKAIKLIKVEYETLPHVLDPFEAMKEAAPELHADKNVTPEGKNIPGEKNRIFWGIEPGDDDGQAAIDAALAQCDVVIEGTFTLPIVKQMQLETMCAVAQTDGNGGATIWSTTQTPHPSRFMLASIFGMPASAIRVLNPPYLGGGFGVRIGLSGKAEPIALALALQTGKPVRVRYDIEDDFMATDTRHGGEMKIRLGAMNDGTFKVLDLGCVLATGAYCTFGVELPAVAGGVTLSTYAMPVKRYIGHSVYTNQTCAGAMRGFGSPQGNFVLERTVDLLAEKLGRDALELRKQNLMKAGGEWFLPYPCSSTELEACMDKGAESIGWEKRYSFDNSGPIKRGIGMAVGSHVSNAWPFCVDYDNAYVTIQVDGSLHLAVGVPDMGTGTSTSLPQVVAEAFGTNLENVYFSYGDTATTPFAIGSHASRTLYAAGLAVKAAAEDARQRIFSYLQEVLNRPVEHFNIIDGKVVINGGTAVISMEEAEKGQEGCVELADVCYYAHIRNVAFIGVGRVIPPNSPPWHACFADVSVNSLTGQIEINKIAASHDVGVAVNPMIVEGQIEGGVVQGIGYALSEEITYHESGRQHNKNMHTYMAPSIVDIPEIDSIIVESHDPQGPYGAKGAGECSLVCPASAIANAVSCALGKNVTEIPMTPERILSLVGRK